MTRVRQVVIIASLTLALSMSSSMRVALEIIHCMCRNDRLIMLMPSFWSSSIKISAKNRQKKNGQNRKERKGNPPPPEKSAGTRSEGGEKKHKRTIKIRGKVQIKRPATQICHNGGVTAQVLPEVTNKVTNFLGLLPSSPSTCFGHSYRYLRGIPAAIGVRVVGVFYARFCLWELLSFDRGSERLDETFEKKYVAATRAIITSSASRSMFDICSAINYWLRLLRNYSTGTIINSQFLLL